MTPVSLKKIIANLLKVDFIVEEGTSGDWTYRKWKSGKIEAWYAASQSFAATTSSNNGWYRTSSQVYATIPSDLGVTAIEYSDISITGIAQAYWLVTPVEANTTRFTGYAVHLGSSTQTGYLRVYFIGTYA